MPWLRENLGKHALAPLTGTDARALQAAVQIVECYAFEREPQLLEAFGSVVAQMQQSTQELAYHALAMVMDWSDRRAIWEPLIERHGLNPLTKVHVCAYEPGGSGR